MIDFEWYRSFVAVYQAGTVSAAAEQRMMTQPAISQHLAALENALNVRLFERTPRKMLPTEAGKQLYSQVIGALEQLEMTSQSAFRREEAPVIRVGAPYEYFYAVGLEKLTLLQLPYRIHIETGLTAHLIAQLENQALDIVIASQNISSKIIHYIPFLTESFILVGPPHLEMPQMSSLEAIEKWLLKQLWIAYGAELPVIRRFWQDAFGKRPQITPQFLFPSLLMILRAVTLGLGVSVVPDYLSSSFVADGTVRVLWSPAHLSTNQLYVACLRARLKNPTIQDFLNSVILSDK
jgi:DNA-binding transcriptional LysR family regulator